MFNEAMETITRPELERIQLERLKQTLHRVYERVPLYRERFDEAGVKPEDLRRLSDLSRFPFTYKRDLRETYPFGMFAVPREQVARLHASSGTKGKPTVVGYTKRDLDVWAEVVARSIACAGGRPGDVLHNAYGYGLFTGGLGLHGGAERLGMTVVPASGGLTERQVELLIDFAADGLSCTPSYALHMAEVMQRKGIDKSALSLRYGIFGAEPWSEGMRRQVEEALGIDALDIYGLSEVMGPGVAMECREEKNGLHVWEDHFLVEVLHPVTHEPVPDGELGELTFTSLSKEAFPIVRYRTGDLASIIAEPCSCGRTHRRMTRIKGRVDDMLIIRGVNVFPQEVEAELMEVEELAPHYQIVLRRDGALDVMEVHVELRPQTAPVILDGEERLAALAGRIVGRLRQRTGLTAAVTIHQPGELPRSEGKAVRVIDERRLRG
ncbi:phenylacetate--CoA ligase family protein [Alicyclobacillus shizuokensis]|uniref:phenylacetate--CoA ligase family protein n=1 Tax=Alicyclobacillus shizuokensis TaxID=392014 RepID=UPI0009FA3237|nr:phenylacetate--CoA ligase [Alicyclobacillus shizuokensis]MCL6626040.1 phenylacetate--CoA ligase [Alicyclobacillus shizuokensis]